MVHPRLKRILSETVSPTPDRPQDQDSESESASAAARAQSSMDISDGDVEAGKVAVHGGASVLMQHAAGAGAAPGASTASQATKAVSRAPPPPRLKITLKLGARPRAASALTFTIPPRAPTVPSEASSHASAESEEADDDADAESEDEAAGDAQGPAADMESEGNVDDSEVHSRTRGRLTARQAVLASMIGADHVELGAHTSRKKTLTSEEIALRREETARKRKNMSEKKLEDEKTETINRLLKKQSSRSRAKRSGFLVVPTPQSPHSGDDGESGGDAPASPIMPGPAWRWVSGRAGIRLGIPLEAYPPPAPAPAPVPAPVVCNVAGCAARRKYRLVQDFERGACGLAHLHVLNQGMVQG